MSIPTPVLRELVAAGLTPKQILRISERMTDYSTIHTKLIANLAEAISKIEVICAGVDEFMTEFSDRLSQVGRMEPQDLQ